MRSHFLPQKVTAVCAVAGATTLLSGTAPAQTFIAADSATNPTYASGWSAGQNGGYGFGPWSFDSTSAPGGVSDPGGQQTMSSAAAIGTAWTLFNVSNVGGISDVGRGISEPGGLQVGQTFQTVIQNPAAYHFYRGFDILFCNGTDNDAGGDNAAAFRLSVFSYFSYDNALWSITDGSPYGSTVTPLVFTNTAAAGLEIDLTLTSPSNYSLTMTPLANPANAFTQTGPLALISTNNNTSLPVTELPINYVNYRLWNTASSGTNDTIDNFEISSMTIEGLNLNIQQAGANAVLSWMDIPGYYLESATSIAPANWASNSISPVTINGENFVTNRIVGHQQFFRLQLQQ